MFAKTKTKASKSNGKNGHADFHVTKMEPIEVKMIAIQEIVSNTSQNPEMGVLSGLYEQGYGLFESATVGKKPIWELLFSDSAEEQEMALNLIEEYEPGIKELGNSLRDKGQLQAIGVVEDTGNGHDCVFGMQRVLAKAYAHKKYNDESEFIEAKIYPSGMSQTQLRVIALEENAKRKQKSPVFMAMAYKELSGEGFSHTQIGNMIGKTDQHVRQYLNLLDKKLEDVRMKVHNGQMSVDKATKLLIKRKGSGQGTTGGGSKEDRCRMPGSKLVQKLLSLHKIPDKIGKYEIEPWEREFWEDPQFRAFWVRKFKVDEALANVPSPPVEKKDKEEPKKTMKVYRERAVKLLIVLGQTNARTYSDDLLREKCEDIVTVAGEKEAGQESESLQQLLIKLRNAYTAGTNVEILPDKKK